MLSSSYQKSYRKYFVNVRCVVCGSSGKGYTSSRDPEEENWESEVCEKAAALWNSRPYLNDDVSRLVVRMGEYVIQKCLKTHTDGSGSADADRIEGDPIG